MRRLPGEPAPVVPDLAAPRDAREPMQRIRVGVTGLASVILLVTLATAIASGVNQQLVPKNATPVVATTAPVDHAANKATTDPLAQIGVTPAPDPTAALAGPTNAAVQPVAAPPVKTP